MPSVRLLIAVLFIVCLGDSVRSNQDLAGVWEGELQDPRRPVATTVDFTALRASFSGGAPVSILTLPSLASASANRLSETHGLSSRPQLTTLCSSPLRNYSITHSDFADHEAGL